MRHIVAVLFAMFVPAAAQACTEGLWWDPSVVGEGWTIECQNDLAAITWYRYEDGQPAFRTIIGTATYAEAQSPETGEQQIVTAMSGPVFRTENFTQNTPTGEFAAEFRLVDGVPTGFVQVEGVQREIIPFLYNYGNTVDFYRGVWSVATFEADGVGEGAAFVFFDTQTQFDGDGTPLRTYTLDDGREGFIYFDETFDFAVSVTFEGDGSYLLTNFTAGDEAVAGIGAFFDANDEILTDVFRVTAMAVANGDAEAEAVLDFNGITPPSKAARLDTAQRARELLPRLRKMPGRKLSLQR